MVAVKHALCTWFWDYLSFVPGLLSKSSFSLSPMRWFFFLPCGTLLDAGRPLRPEGSLSGSALDVLLDEDARLPYLKCLPVSQCVPHSGGDGVRTMSSYWRSFAGTLWHHLSSRLSRLSWRRFLGHALAHHLCRRQPVDVCAENAGFCPLGCLAGHLTLLLSAPKAYPLDGPLTPKASIWERLGLGLGYFGRFQKLVYFCLLAMFLT